MQTENETTAPESPKIRELPRDRHLSLVSPWVDVTSFSQNAKDRTPRTWKAKFGRFNLVLTRHRDYPSDKWVTSCHGVIHQQAMASADLGEAACQAKAMLQVALEDAIQEILGANDLGDARRADADPNQTPSSASNPPTC